jgi:hypothetical protein
MFRIVKDPPTAFIGDHQVELLDYSDTLASKIKAPMESLRGVRIDQYPQMLDCSILLDNDHAIPELESCYLYKTYPGHGIQLGFIFGSPDGVWKNDVAIGAAYRELFALDSIEKYKETFDIENAETGLFFTQHLDETSSVELYEVVQQALAALRGIVDQINWRLFGFRWKDAYQTDEPLFTQEVVIPILRSMGFQSVRYNHGVNEFGRDVLFADLDKFSTVRHYAAQVKAGDISASNGTLLNQLIAQIDDAFSMPVKGPGRSKHFHISEIYIICSGKITTGAIERLNQKIDSRLVGSVHFLDFDDIEHLAKSYLLRK